MIKKRKAAVLTPVKTTAKRPALVEASRLNAQTRPAVAKSRLQLAKRHGVKKKLHFASLPYVAQSDMYDEQWADKQERAFMQWINYELSAGAEAITPQPSSVADQSYRHFAAHMAYEGVRRAASLMYQSESFQVVLLKLDKVHLMIVYFPIIVMIGN